MATATIHICDVCGKEDKKQTEFKLKVYTSGGEVVREMDLCLVCNENLGKIIAEVKAPPQVKPLRAEKKERSIDLLKDVFAPVMEKVKERRDELKGLQRRRLHAFYLAGWLSELLMEVLQDSEVKPHLSPNGPDITFGDKSKLTLKGSTSFDLEWFVKDGAVKPGTPLLFLGNGRDKQTIGQLKRCSGIKVLTYEYLNDGEDDWIVTLIRRV